ncbi:MAG: P22 phage major capsid protein family protein, partial [Bacteroidia bacterium]
LGVLMQFVVTTTQTTTGAWPVSPTPITSGPLQNCVVNSAGSSKAVNIAGTASTNYGQSMVYHQDAFTFATADLIMPGGVDFARREVLDGVSMRIVRAYDINNDNLPCRIDVLYGYKTIRPQLAARLANLAG